MTQLRLENDSEVLTLDGIASEGFGVQAISGATGFGLPPVSVQWLEGAGDGATYRGQRILPRDIDLPLHILGEDRADMKRHLTKLTRTLAKTCRLIFTEEDNTEWETEVHRVGGGDYTYGVDTNGTYDLSMVITLRAGDPFFSAVNPVTAGVGRGPGNRGLLPNLISLKVSPSQAIGSIDLENNGDAVAYPTWEVTGPGNNFRAVSPDGDTLHWAGSLAVGEKLFIDTKTGLVTDGNGVSRYADMAYAPRFWPIQPGVTTAEASLQDTAAGSLVDGVVVGASSVACTFKPRKWLVI